MRKMITLLATLALLLTLALPANADTSPAVTTAVFTIGSITYTVNGVPQQMDVAPVIDSQTNRTYIPVRFLALALGASVNWDPQNQTVTLTDGGTTEVMVIGGTALTVNGQGQTMDTAPQIVPPGRTVLPASRVTVSSGGLVTGVAQGTTGITVPGGPQGKSIFQKVPQSR